MWDCVPELLADLARLWRGITDLCEALFKLQCYNARVSECSTPSSSHGVQGQGAGGVAYLGKLHPTSSHAGEACARHSPHSSAVARRCTEASSGRVTQSA